MLYDRIINEGTLNDPGGKSEPHFALPSTVNWMRALAMLIDQTSLDFESARNFYRRQRVRRMDRLEENTVLEQLFLALHHLSALEQFRLGDPVSDFARVGILAWYYGIANAASAMTAAKSGAFKEDHAGTAKLWDTDISGQGLAMVPFNWRVSSLVSNVYKDEIAEHKIGSTGGLLTRPETQAGAQGAAIGYLSGSAKWYREREEDKIRQSREFRELEVENFRTRLARELRDGKLARKSVGFLHEASRYRGKANYREALFLAYGNETEAKLEGYSADLALVLRGFLSMAGAFVSRKLDGEIWADFVADVDANRSFSMDASDIWT